MRNQEFKLRDNTEWHSTSTWYADSLEGDPLCVHLSSNLFRNPAKILPRKWKHP